MEEKIKKVIEDKVNPMLSEHYGGAMLTRFEDGVVWIRMTGACGQCPSAQQTIEGAVKEIITENVEGVTDVCLDTSVSEDLLDMARKILNKEV
ncbi:NifU family protein [Sinanaerobacter sp. ZZT-01]|uniref:NifU family protein n=1 Tax=Sinanaerobacter sp. ZZT-01 TaxID=3111540 RepID=UPI002D767AEA|nr:NifU family protein [Sinanaerobacter sp. ZZT-01]WRR94557.1 NifU family protein [Sinanaerobacter sp. ZZT-01]